MEEDMLIYSSRAYLYDLIYHKKNYKQEVEEIINIISSKIESKNSVLLDIGCGTGKHLHYFSQYYSCIGIDNSLDMLSIAKQRLSEAIVLEVSSMDTIQLTSKIDIIVSLFSSINYTSLSLFDLLTHWKELLNDRGIIIIDIPLRKESFEVLRHSLQIYKDDKIKITRFFSTSIQESKPTLEFNWTIAKDFLPLETFTETHTISLFSEKEFESVAKEINLNYSKINNYLLLQK